MKQMKFFLVALMVLTSMSFTSCMKGEDNTVVPVFCIITLKSNFLQCEFQVAGGGVTFVSNKTVESLMNASPGDIVFLSAQYDTETQPVDQNTSKIYVDVNFAVKINSNVSTGSYDTEASKSLANRTIIPLSNYQGALPSMYGSDWVIIPIPYYTEKYENITQHSFTLAYLKDEEVKNSTLKLHLYHNSLETIDKEKTVNVTYNSYEAYKAFNISSLISSFKTNNGGQTPQKIVVVTQEGSSSIEITGENTDKYTEKEYNVEGYTAE